MDILDEIIAYKRKEIAERTQFVSIERLYQLVETMEPMDEGSMSKQLMAMVRLPLVTTTIISTV